MDDLHMGHGGIQYNSTVALVLNTHKLAGHNKLKIPEQNQEKS
jgi:hypothetical protein